MTTGTISRSGMRQKSRWTGMALCLHRSLARQKTLPSTDFCYPDNPRLTGQALVPRCLRWRWKGSLVAATPTSIPQIFKTVYLWNSASPLLIQKIQRIEASKEIINSKSSLLYSRGLFIRTNLVKQFLNVLLNSKSILQWLKKERGEKPTQKVLLHSAYLEK